MKIPVSSSNNLLFVLRKDEKTSPVPQFQQVPHAGAEHPIFTGATPIGMISGEQPRFPSAPGGHEALKTDLDALGLRHEETEGRYGTPERSFIVHGPTRDQITSLGKKYGQDAVIHSVNGQHQMIYTNGINEGKYHPSMGTHDFWSPHEEGPEDYYTKLPNQGTFRLHFDFNRLHQDTPSGPVATPYESNPATMTKYEIGSAVYKTLKNLVKSYEAVPGSFSDQDVPAPGAAKAAPQYSPSFPWLPHPHSYDWHDAHTAHNYMMCASGGVAMRSPQAPDSIVKSLNKSLSKSEINSVVFGSHTDKPANLVHYDYSSAHPAVDQTIADHGYQTYSGKPDHGRKNYDTKHLHIAVTGDPSTDAYRKVHELSHALTHNEVNAKYGEGKRQGKLGHHRTLKEAMRAVHWEYLAAHKQRELNKQLGIHVPEETFNRELNTVLHDSVHRLIHGRHTDLSSDGFKPHSHKVPLETALNVVKESARNLGLQGETDKLSKAETVSDKKTLTIIEGIDYLKVELQKRIDDFAYAALELRKKETEALSKGQGVTKAKKLITNTFHGSDKHLGDSVQPSNPPYHKTGFKKEEFGENASSSDSTGDSGSQPASGTDYQGGQGGSNNMNMAEAAADAPDGQMGNPAAAAADPGSGMALKEKNMKKMILPGELSKPPNSTSSAPSLPSSISKHELMCKCASCSKIEKYAKGELSMNKSAKKNKQAEDTEWEAMKVQAQLDSKKPKTPSGSHPYRKATPNENKEWDEMKDAAGVTGYAAGNGPNPKKPNAADKEWASMKADATKKAELEKKSPPGRKEEVEKLKAKGLPASEAFGIAWKQQNENGKPNKKSQPNTFVDNSKGKGKLPPEKTKEVAAESEGGNDGTDTDKGKSIKKAGMAMGGAMPKAPGAPKLAGGAIPPPHPGMKPMKLPGMSMTPKIPKSASPAMGAASTGGMGMGKKELAKAGLPSVRDQKNQTAKLPGVRASVGGLMDRMLAPKPMLPHTPAPQLAGVGQRIARPAQGIQTMAERVASKMPANGPTFSNPPAQAKPQLPGAVPATSPSVPALHELAAAHMPGVVKKPVQTMVERAASKMPSTASMQVPGEKSHRQLLHEARKSEKKMKKMEYGLSLSEMGPCALCKKAEHAGPCK